MQGQLARKSQARPSLTAKVLLYGIILAVCWSPRLRLGLLPGENVDIRLQDPLIVVAVGYLILAPAAPIRARWDLVWGKWLSLFLATAVVTTFLHMMIAQPVSDLLRVAYLGRTIEMFILAVAVCGLYLRAGISHLQVGWVLRLGAWANLIWIGYQHLTGTRETFFGELSETIGSYGPVLIGEPSAFGTGVFLMFAATLTIADYRARTVPAPISLLVLVAIIGAAYLVESRVNLITIVAMLAFLSPRHLRTLFNAPAVTYLLLGGAVALLLFADKLVGRLSFESLTHSLGVRFGIWSLLADYTGNWFVIGVGPGGLARSVMGWDEAHNIAVRAWLDFGILGAILLFAALGRAFLAAVRAARPGTDQTDGLRWAATLAGLIMVGVFVAGMVQDALTAVTSTHLLMVALGIFAAEISRASSRTGADSTAAPSSEAVQSERKPRELTSTRSSE